jgi:DNA-binding XRE family transcriptional regulator
MATMKSTTKEPPSGRQSNARNPRLRDIMQKGANEAPYLLMSPRHSNTQVVSAALGAVLAAQRQSVELTQKAAAQRASITPSYLRAVEKGCSQPNFSVLLSMCEAIGIDPRELLNRTLDKIGYPVGFIPVRSPQHLT